MARNFAITIGINKYEYIRSLKYAATDAEKVRDFLLTEAGFNQVFYYSDHSPSIKGVPTRPTRSSLLRLLKLTFEKEFMGAGDNFWFFFSGHGARVKGVDYIIPSDTFAEDIENSAISVNYIIQRLQRCGADNVVLILDACREQGDDLSKSITGMGEQTEREAREKGVISICSCSPNEYSWELEELQQGAFTYALLEGLGSKGRKATVERLNEHLKYRVKELAQRKGQQTPRVMADPIEKSHLILMPKYATLGDIAILKNYATRAQRRGKLQEAKSLWRRVLNAAQGIDEDAIEALNHIAIQENLGIQSSPSPTSDNSENKSPKAVDNSSQALPKAELKSEVSFDHAKFKDVADLKFELNNKYFRLLSFYLHTLIQQFRQSVFATPISLSKFCIPFLVFVVLLISIISVPREFTLKSSKTEATNPLPDLHPIFQATENPKPEPTVTIESPEPEPTVTIESPEPDRELLSIWENANLNNSNNIDVEIIKQQKTNLILLATGDSSKQKAIDRKIDSKRNALAKIASYLALQYKDESEAKQLFITGELIKLTYQNYGHSVTIWFKLHLSNNEKTSPETP